MKEDNTPESNLTQKANDYFQDCVANPEQPSDETAKYHKLSKYEQMSPQQAPHCLKIKTLKSVIIQLGN